MKTIVATIVSVHSGSNDDLSKEEHASIQVELDGIVGDRHRSYVRDTWKGDKQPFGTVRRNERQWSAVSVEELGEIAEQMDVQGALTATSLGANLCIEGIPGFSQLPGGTRLRFPSGAALMIEESNPPCAEMGAEIAAAYTTSTGEPAVGKMFPKHSMGLRGVVGVVDVPGQIRAGDRVIVDARRPHASEVVSAGPGERA